MGTKTRFEKEAKGNSEMAYLGSMKKKTNTVESRNGNKQNQSNERHLNLPPPSSIREVLHDQVLLWNCNRMNLCNRKFPSAVKMEKIICDDFQADGEF